MTVEQIIKELEVLNGKSLVHLDTGDLNLSEVSGVETNALGIVIIY